jgi:hypothetical protein
VRTFLLKAGATVLTVGTTMASALYVTAHMKNPAAPLQPTVLKSSTSTAGGVTIGPSVQAGNVQPVTSTYAS